jgi:hypothetical protein
MSADICETCTEYSYDCKCVKGVQQEHFLQNYFLSPSEMHEEVKVWTQMFFDDGSVTQGKYITRTVFDDESKIESVAFEFLHDTGRKEGVLFIWGAGRVYARGVELFLPRKGRFKGCQTLRFRRL